MTREEAISHIEFSIKAYQNLIDNDVRSGEVIDENIKGEWKSEQTLADLYKTMIDSLKMAIEALEEVPCEDCVSALNRVMEYTYGMLTTEKAGLQHLIKSMLDELSSVNPQEKTRQKTIPVEEIEKAWESIADVTEGSYVDIEEIKFWIAKWLDKDEAEL